MVRLLWNRDKGESGGDGEDSRSTSAGLVLVVWRGRFRVSCMFEVEWQGCVDCVFSA
jgi:hypothetical protein